MTDVSIGLFYCKALLNNFTDKNLIPEDWLNDRELKVYRYIKDYFRKFRTMPTVEAILNDLEIELPEIHEPIEYYISKIRERKKINISVETTNKLVNYIENRQIDQWIKEAKELIRYWNSFLEERKGVRCLKDLKDDIVRYFDYIEKTQHGELIGLPSLWPQLDRETLGWQAGDLITIVGKLGVGKTFFSLLLAKAVYEIKKKILFVSMEMTQEKIGLRFISILKGIPWDKVRRGQLSPEEFNELWNTILNDDRFYVVDSSSVRDVIDIQIMIEEYQPDLVIVDGMYLISGREWEKINELVRSLKLTAVKYQIPIIQVTQFNRQLRKNREPTTDYIGFSNAIGEDSDVILGLTKRDKEYQTLRVNVLKIRDGVAKPLQINWDFENMNYDFVRYINDDTIEVPEPEDDSDEAEEEGMHVGWNFSEF